MPKEKTAKHIKLGRVDDSPYTEKVKQKNRYIMEAIKEKRRTVLVYKTIIQNKIDEGLGVNI